MRHAGNGIVRYGTAQVFCRHFFHSDRFDDLRSRNEHVARVLYHVDEIGQGRTVDGTAGTGSHDDRNLGNDSGRLGIIHKDAAKSGKGIDTFLDAGTAGIIDTDNGSSHFECHFLYLADLVGMHFPKRAAFDGKIFCIGKDEAAIDIAVSRDDAVAGDFLLFHAKIGAAVMDKLADFGKTAFVKKHMQPFPGCHLPFFMLFINFLLAAAHFYRIKLLMQELNLFLNCCHNAPPIHFIA